LGFGNYISGKKVSGSHVSSSVRLSKAG
jgi:hypothetical protein